MIFAQTSDKTDGQKKTTVRCNDLELVYLTNFPPEQYIDESVSTRTKYFVYDYH